MSFVFYRLSFDDGLGRLANARNEKEASEELLRSCNALHKGGKVLKEFLPIGETYYEDGQYKYRSYA